MVDIFFGAATYDEIEKDVKVTLEAALGLIGGTMGLLTGFSVISGVEIIFFLFKLISSLNILKNTLTMFSSIREMICNH